MEDIIRNMTDFIFLTGFPTASFEQYTMFLVILDMYREGGDWL